MRHTSLLLAKAATTDCAAKWMEKSAVGSHAAVLARWFALSVALLAACQPPPPGADADVDGATDGSPDLAVGDLLPAPQDLSPEIDENGLASSPDLAPGSDLASSSDLGPGADLATPAQSPCAPGCADGKPCSAAADCAGLKCDHGLCATNACLDGKRDGKESDADCGGGACPKCGVGKSCGGNGDCLSGQCKAAKCAGALTLSFATLMLPDIDACVLFAGQGIAVGDFNGDQIPDVLASGSGCSKEGAGGGAAGVTVWLSDGKGGFGPALVEEFVWNQNPHFEAPACFVIGVGDFDGDQKLDVVARCGFDNKPIIEVFLGLGDGLGGFGKQGAVVAPEDAQCAGDWNGDKRLDLDSAGQVFLGDGKWSFIAQQPPVIPAYRYPGIFAGDLNGDQHLDSVVEESVIDQMFPPPAPISILLGDGRGNFEVGRQVPTGGKILALADVNSDGRLDLVLVDANGVSTTLGLGDGTFGPAIPSPAVMADTGWRTMACAAADFDGDGALDLACGLGSKINPGLVLLGGGDGTFKPVAIPLPPFFGDAVHFEIETADFNRDGKPDLVYDGAVVLFNTSH